MDLGIIIVLLLILYVFPELLRRRRPQKYEYPDIPAPIKLEMPDEFSMEHPTEIKHHTPVKPTIAMPPEVPVPSIQEQSAWQGKINNTLIYNGIVFAELLQPPRAKRPILREIATYTRQRT